MVSVGIGGLMMRESAVAGGEVGRLHPEHKRQIWQPEDGRYVARATVTDVTIPAAQSG